MFPYILNGEGIIDHDRWLSENKERMLEDFRTHGAILFRNFPIHTNESLRTFISKLSGDNLLNYEGGTSPRNEVDEGIYTSTKMPFFLKIPLHSEMVYRKQFPENIFFYCAHPPLEGGETPIVDLRKVEKDLSSGLKDRVKNHGIIYYRHLKSDTSFRRFLSRFNPMILTGTWQHVFHSNDKKAVEDYCGKHNFSFEWLSDNSVILKTHLPGFYKGQWLNSLHFFQVHHRIWGRILASAFKVIRYLSGAPDMSATDGEGNKFSSENIAEIVNAMEKHKVEFKWQKHDLLMMNNTITAHGRNSYLGKRKILVSMSKPAEFNWP